MLSDNKTSLHEQCVKTGTYICYFLGLSLKPGCLVSVYLCEPERLINPKCP